MTTRERRQRERHDREQCFLGAARGLIRMQGLLGLQMARVADACEYAIGTLYQHFTSKEDLLLALATDSLRQRAAAFVPIPELSLPSRERMLAVVLTDLDFQQAHPEHFPLDQYVRTEVVWSSASAERRKAFLAEGAPIAEVVSRVVSAAIEAGDLPARGLRPVELAAGSWCLNTGMHTLVRARGTLETFAVRAPYERLLYHTHALFNGLGWKPLVDLDAAEARRAREDRVREALQAAPRPEDFIDYEHRRAAEITS